MRDVNELVQTVFSGLSPLVIEEVADEGERIVVRARTPTEAAVCPVCGAPSGRVHGYHCGRWPTCRSTVGGWWFVCGCGAWCVPRGAAATPSANRCPECWSDTSAAPPA